MQSANTYTELLQARGKKGLPLERVYRQLFNRDLYLAAYGKIYRNKGAMTKGTTDETPDGMSLEKIDSIIEAMRSERYQWTPAKRVYIPKKGRTNKKRPLGIPVWSDKLVQEVLHTILENYFEPRFSEHSHGFRPSRGCHTALREIYYNWHGTSWYIEGDISACFDSLNHEMLVSILSEHIHDGRFINLIRKLLDAGYLENWSYHRTLSGVPQGSIVGPILSNIYLDKLDKFVETILIPQYTKGEKRAQNKEYKRLINRAHKLFKKGRTQEAQAVRNQAQQMPSIDPDDPHYRRLKYCRYADDFLMGFVGPKSEAEEIKQKLEAFLRDEMKLELSKTKTLITHARSEAARFLGYELTTIQKDEKRTRSEGTIRKATYRRSINGRPGLQVPRDVVKGKSDRYKRRGKVVHRAELLNDSDYTIITTYQLEYRGIVNYYRLAYNLHALDHLKWVMQQSLTKTLAHKHRISVNKVYGKYKSDIDVDGTMYKGLRVIVPREGKKPLVATWGGIPLTWDIQATLEDQPKPVWERRTELERRFMAQVCEYCGTNYMMDKIEVHHIRALKDLNKYTGRDKPEWVKIMAARKRKTLVLCRTCHQDVTFGRPMRRQSIKRLNAKAAKAS